MISDAQRIAITACGVVSSIGIGRHGLWRGLTEGRSGIVDVSLFDTTALRSHRAAEIRDFDPHSYLEGKPLRGMSRSAHLACSAAALALAADAARGDASAASARMGLVAGTAYGNVNSMVRFDRETWQEGPRFVDAMLFPNTVINSPAGFVSIFFGITGPNTTIADGVASSCAAFDYAASLLQRGGADEVLAGGFEELSQWVYLGLHNSGRLAGSRPGDSEDSAPFDRRRTGIVLGEGAAFLRLTRPEVVAASGQTPLAWMIGQGEAFVAGKLAAPDALDAATARAAMARSMRMALENARLQPHDIDVVWASASGARDLDALEAAALAEVFGARLAELPIVAMKSAVGECFGASGALQVAGALLTLRDGVAPPTVGFQSSDAAVELRGLCSCTQRVESRHILLNAFNGLGNNRTLVLARG